MIDLQVVGAILREDLDGYHFTAQDARLAVANRVAADIKRLLDTGTGSITDGGALVLYRATRYAAARSMLQATTASRVAQILADAGVPALVYKGVALAMACSGDWQGRDSFDVDVVIDPRNVGKAHHAFMAAGMQRRGGSAGAPTAFQRYREFETSYAGLSVIVDLHWQVDSPGYLDIPFQETWARRQRFERNGLSIWAPGTAEMLLIAALHGNREEWTSLRHILDFARLVKSVGDDGWQSVEHLARRGPQRSLAVALGVARICDVNDLPVEPEAWAMKVAQSQLEATAAVLRLGQHPLTLIEATPRAALRRRIYRWRVAPNIRVATSGLLRSTIRQMSSEKRSWSLRDRQT